jgi:hypothetical protein
MVHFAEAAEVKRVMCSAGAEATVPEVYSIEMSMTVERKL